MGAAAFWRVSHQIRKKSIQVDDELKSLANMSSCILWSIHKMFPRYYKVVTRWPYYPNTPTFKEKHTSSNNLKYLGYTKREIDTSPSLYKYFMIYLALSIRILF